MSLTAGVPNRACLGQGSCWPRGSLVSPHAAPLGSLSPRAARPGPRPSEGLWPRSQTPAGPGAAPPGPARGTGPGSVCPAAPGGGSAAEAGEKRGEAGPPPARRERDTGAQIRTGRGAPSPGAAGLETFGLSFPGYERSGDGAEGWAVFWVLVCPRGRTAFPPSRAGRPGADRRPKTV